VGNACDAFAATARNISLPLSNPPLRFTLSSGEAAYRRAQFASAGVNSNRAGRNYPAEEGGTALRTEQV